MGREGSESPSDSEYSSEEERRRKRKHREKKKRKHKRRSYESDGSSEDEKGDKKRKRKRRSHSSDEESDEKRKRSRREKRRKSKHHSSDDDSESESERRKKKKMLKMAKKLLKDAEKGDSSKKSQVEKITEDDYFLKSNEFATWLKENHKLYFSNMSSEETRAFFVKFVDAWNSGSLASKFYEGIKKGARTNHKWNFQDEQVDEEEKRMQKRKQAKVEQKKFQKEHELVMDELLPQATGRERLLEKKAIQREKNRNRDLSPEPMRESDIMGGGDDFKAMLARERARREKRSTQKLETLQKKLSAVEEKESAAMDQFRALLSNSGGKISIPKRTE